MNPIRGFRQLLKEWFPDKAACAWFVFTLLIATVYWLATVTEEKEVRSYAAAVRFVNVPDGFAVVGPDSRSRVNIELAASDEVLKKLTQEDIKLEIDASAFAEGPLVHEIAPSDMDLPSSISLVSVFPKVLQLQLDKVVQGRINLKPQFSGRLKGGKQVVSWRIEPPAVEVTGPESVIAGVRNIPTQPVLLGERESDFEVPVVPIVDDPELTVKESPGGHTLKVAVGEKKAIRSVEGVKISVLRLTPDLEARLEPEHVTVSVEGEAEKAEKIAPGEVLAQIDVGGLKAEGTPYRIKPVVELRGENGRGCRVASTSPAYVEVTIRERGSV